MEVVLFRVVRFHYFFADSCTCCHQHAYVEEDDESTSDSLLIYVLNAIVKDSRKVQYEEKDDERVYNTHHSLLLGCEIHVCQVLINYYKV